VRPDSTAPTQRSAQRTRLDMGVGLYPLTPSDQDMPAGHMWLKWTDPKSGGKNYRGFYACFDSFPEKVQQDRKLQRRLVVKGAVPGEIRDDVRAAQLEERFGRGEQYYSADWAIDQGRAARLDELCPVGARDLYSWSEDWPDCDNCSSWAIATVNAAMGDPTFLQADRPRALSSVMECLWGDGPHHQRWDTEE
jgi:hypothetical protein